MKELSSLNWFIKTIIPIASCHQIVQFLTVQIPLLRRIRIMGILIATALPMVTIINVLTQMIAN